MRAGWLIAALLAVLVGFGAGFFLYSMTDPTGRAPRLVGEASEGASAATAAEELASAAGEEAPALPERDDVAPTRTTPAAEPPLDAAPLLEAVAIDAASGAPLPDLRAFLGSAPGEPQWTAAGGSGQTFFTDEAGRVSFPAVAGRALVLSFVRDDGPAWPREAIPPLAAGERREVLVELATGIDRVFWGRVIDDASDLPIQGCRVSVRHRSEVEGAVWEATSDAEGLFELRLATWQMGDAELRATAYPEATFLLAGGHELPERAMVLRLSRAAALAGEIKPGNGPMPRVVCVSFADAAFVLPRRTEITDAGTKLARGPRGLRAIYGAIEDGAFRLEGLPAGAPGTLEVLDKEYRGFEEPYVFQKQDLEPFNPGEARWMDLHLGSGEIRGHIVDQDGELLGGIELWRRRAEYAEPSTFLASDRTRDTVVTRSEPDGSFRFTDVPIGLWWVGPGAGAAAEVPAWGEVVELPAGEESVVLELQVWRGLRLAGQVVDAAGAPLAQVRVVGRAAGSAGDAQTVSGEGGAFTLSGLRPVDYVVVAGGAGTTFQASEAVVARPGRTDLVLRVEPGASVRVRVVGEQIGTQAAMCDVSLLPERPGLPERLVARVMFQGAYVFSGLAPGTYAVLARSDDGRVGLARRIEVRAGAEPTKADVRLEPSAELRLVGSGTAPLRSFTLAQDGLVFAAGGLLPGRVVHELVPAGALTVRVAEAEGGAREHLLELAAGELRELDVDAE